MLSSDLFTTTSFTKLPDAIRSDYSRVESDKKWRINRRWQCMAPVHEERCLSRMISNLNGLKYDIVKEIHFCLSVVLDMVTANVIVCYSYRCQPAITLIALISAV